MPVFAANVTAETKGLIEDLLATDKYVKFALQNRINLNDNTVLLRLGLMALENQIPSNEYITIHKAALVRPGEFEDWMRKRVEQAQKEIIA